MNYSIRFFSQFSHGITTSYIPRNEGKYDFLHNTFGVNSYFMGGDGGWGMGEPLKEKGKDEGSSGWEGEGSKG